MVLSPFYALPFGSNCSHAMHTNFPRPANNTGRIEPAQEEDLRTAVSRAAPKSHFTLPALVLPLATTVAAESAAIFFRPGLVHIQRPAIEFSTIQAGNGSVGFGSHTHFHEPEASGASGVPVGYNVHTVNRAVFFKHGSDRIFGSPEAEVSYENILHLKSSF
jgi:hypothetical protein